MTSLKLRYLVPIALVLLAAGAFLATRSHSEASTTVQALVEDTHFHGIAVDPTDSSRLYLATHHGLYAVAADGLLGFTPHPTNPSILDASAIRPVAVILASSSPKTLANPGASSPRAWAGRSTSIRWT